MPRFRPAARSQNPELDRVGKERRDHLRAAFVTSLVAMTTGVCPAQIHSRTRNKADAARARQIAMYLSHISFEWPLARVGAAFGRDRSTASHACHRVEDLRDDARFDANLNAMETCLRNAPGDGPNL